MGRAPCTMFRGDLDTRTTKQNDLCAAGRAEAKPGIRARNRARHQEEAKGNYRVLGSRGQGGQAAEGVGRGRQGKPG